MFIFQMFIEYCGGGALDSIMVDLEKPLSEPMIRYVAHEMCVALAFLHERRVIHRDIKAGNVLLTSEGEVKLGWFLLHCSVLQNSTVLSSSMLDGEHSGFSF